MTVAATTSIHVCGVVTAYTAATASSPGSITISGQTFSIAPGTIFGPEVHAGTTLCFDLPIAVATIRRDVVATMTPVVA